MSVKLLSAILGPEMAAPILWVPGKMRSFINICQFGDLNFFCFFFVAGDFWGSVGRGGLVPCPSFPWFLGIPRLILSKEFPCLLEWVFSSGFFQGFIGFGREIPCLNGCFLLGFSKVRQGTKILGSFEGFPW